MTVADGCPPAGKREAVGVGIRVLAIGDLHGHWGFLWQAVEEEKPDLLLSVGDWGDPGQVTETDFRRLLRQVLTYTVYGNHDDIALLSQLSNGDGTPVLLPAGVAVQVGGLRLAGISGIWAKSKKKPYYITDEQILHAARSIERKGVQILVTHACPVGLADVTPKGTHGGQRSLLDAFKIVQPLCHLCGHLHRPQMRTLKSGQIVLNAGFGAQGDYALLDVTPQSVSVIKTVTLSLQ